MLLLQNQKSLCSVCYQLHDHTLPVGSKSSEWEAPFIFSQRRNDQRGLHYRTLKKSQQKILLKIDERHFLGVASLKILQKIQQKILTKQSCVISKFAPAKIGKVKSPLFGNLTGPT